MLSLTPELTATVLHSLSQVDLACVALVSKSFLVIARPILYQSITLYQGSIFVKDTFQLLTSDRPLALQCTRLHLHTEHQMTGPTWLDFDALRQLTHLQDLQLDGCPFYTEIEQQEFVDLSAQSWTRLSELVYWHGTMRLGSNMHTMFPGQSFRICGLKKIIWHEAGCFSHSAAMSLIIANSPTLCELKLPLHFDDFACDASSQLWSLSFPRLEIFHLGYPLDPGDHDIDVQLTIFLVAHPSIRDLALGFASDDEWSISLSSDNLTVDMLPHLRALHANVNVLTSILRAGVEFTCTLEELSTGDGLVPFPDEDLSSFIDALESAGGLPQLKVMRFEPGESLGDHRDRLKDAIACMAKLCPALEVLSGSLPSMSTNAIV
ncbi:hypothetical protein HGRIS_004621 [Hohenbuehelia grisea]|uniref:F-box domain-containing protein n=1 Tax=Hohenbuehelia grisea TaxID=104357 RepID=A0ABR3JCN8_9AGAR